jgi:hypothetical protein
MVQWGIRFPIVQWRPIFEKSSHLREKGGVLMLFKTTPHLGAKAQYARRAVPARWKLFFSSATQRRSGL